MPNIGRQQAGSVVVQDELPYCQAGYFGFITRGCEAKPALAPDLRKLDSRVAPQFRNAADTIAVIQTTSYPVRLSDGPGRQN